MSHSILRSRVLDLAPGRTLLAALAVVSVVARPASAALTGTMSGVVKDVSGQPLPGVSVVVAGPVLQGTRSAITGGDGSFFIPNLPPGPGYNVAFQLSGFQKAERVNQSVALDRDTQVNAALALSSVASEVVVTGEAPVVDVTRTNTAQNFDEKYLRKLTIGSGGRNYLTIAAQAPGVVGTGNSSVMGGNAQQNAFLIDGINNTDPITHTFGTNLNFDSIQEVSVQTSGFLAESGHATGGILNVVTKSGGNELHGTADVRYNSNKFSEKGDQFDPSVSESRNTPWAVTLGGPVVRDRLWFFVGTQRNDNFVTPNTTNAAILAQNPSPVARGYKGWDSSAKLSFTLSERFNGFANFIDSRATVRGANNSVLFRPEADATAEQPGQIYSLKLNGAMTGSWIGELQLGRSDTNIDTFPTSGDIATTAWVNTGGANVRYDNYNNFQTSNRTRNTVGLNSTYYASNLVGSHELKVGFEYEKTKAVGVNFTTGTPTSPEFCPTGLTCGATINFNGFDADGNRRPTTQTVSERLGSLARSGNGQSVYLQDRWRPIPQLTLNLGVRYDRNEYINNQDVSVLSYDKIQPRLAAAYDVMGDGKTVARASYGLFYEDVALTLARLFYTGTASAIARTYSWNAAQQRWLFTRQTGGIPNSAALIDGPLKPTYDEAVNVAFEREVIKNGSVSATYVYKKTHDMFEDTCITNAECADFWVSNQPGKDVGLSDVLTKDYYAYILQFEYRFLRGMVNASYTYSKSRGSVDSSISQFAGADFDHFPENYQNLYGFLADDARNRFKVFASYTIPFVEAGLGVNYTYRSGAPYNVTSTGPEWGTQYEEPRGTSRTQVLHVVDLQLEKIFTLPVAGGVQLSVIGSVFNVANSEQATAYSGVTTVGNVNPPASLRTPVTYQRPRNYQIGFRAQF